jgi:hypothetical protein
MENASRATFALLEAIAIGNMLVGGGMYFVLEVQSILIQCQAGFTLTIVV